MIRNIQDRQRNLTSSRKRGNPNWGKPMDQPAPVVPTEFEVRVKSLGLREGNYTKSEELRKWCEHNKNRVYIPEWLLKNWGIPVDVTC